MDAKPASTSRRRFLIVPLALVGLYIVGKFRGEPVGYHSAGSIDFSKITNVDNATGKSLIDAGAIVIDVRQQDMFDYRHIAGAILIPLFTLEAGIPLSFAAAKTASILVYCNDGINHGPEATAILNKAGYVNAVNLKHGIEGWADAGLPIEKNSAATAKA